jgi:hypothetical protein
MSDDNLVDSLRGYADTDDISATERSKLLAAADAIERLRNQNEDLLEALIMLLSASMQYQLQDSDLEVGLAQAAINKARGE